MNGYRIEGTCYGLAKNYIRQELSIPKVDLKKDKLLDYQLTALLLCIVEIVERNFDETFFSPEMLEGALEKKLGSSSVELRKDLRRLSQTVWKKYQPKLFTDFFSAPSPEALVCRFTAMVVTRPSLISMGLTGLQFREPVENRLARTLICGFLDPRKVRNRHELSAFLFIINNAIEEIRGGAVALLSSKHVTKYYTHALKESSYPCCTAKEVRALFRSQQPRINKGKVFGVDRPSPMPSELYYLVLRALVARSREVLKRGESG